jgi:hypothetical protein
VSILTQHLVLLPTLFVVAALTLWLPAWKLTSLLAGVALGVQIAVAWWGGSVAVATWTLGVFGLVAAANVIIVAAGPRDDSRPNEGA